MNRDVSAGSAPGAAGRLTLPGLWELSGRVHAEAGFQGLRKRAAYVARARAVAPLLATLLDAAPSSLLGGYVAGRAPTVLGLVEAPYINARWDAETRLKAFIRHCALLATMGPAFDFALNESVKLPPIEALGPDYTVILDKPAWGQREGLLAISVFRGNVRLFSLSFSFDEIEGRKTILIGGVQGRRIEGALEEYSRLTDLAHGLHPRKLLIEILRMIGAEVGTERILAISDRCRHHRHPFFGKKAEKLPLDYDEIWRDRDGEATGDGSFFELPLTRLVRDLGDLAELSPRKRKKRRHQYRLRYPMLDVIEADLRAALPGLVPEVRPEPE